MRYGEQGGPLAVAHRGGSGLGPENTLATFARSHALGMRHLETDVRVTRDGQLVCFHDATLQRIGGRPESVADLTLPRLRRLLPDVPTLAEAYDTFPDTCFSVDVKDADAIDLLATMLRSRPDRAARTCVAGAWDGWLTRLVAEVPGLQAALGWRSLTALVAGGRCRAPLPRSMPWAPFAHVPVRLGLLPVFVPRLVERAHDLGVRVVVWTVDDPALMHRLLDTGVDGVITDRPDVLREVLLARGQWVRPDYRAGQPVGYPRPVAPQGGDERP